MPGLTLRLVVPESWREYGVTRRADPRQGALDVCIAPVRWADAGPAKWYLHHYPSLSAIVRDFRPDVIHLWEEPWSLVAMQARWLRDRHARRAALVLETDQNILRRLPGPFEWMRRRTLRHTDLLVVRQDEAEAVSRACGYAGPTRHLGYGVDQAVFFPGPKDRARQALGIAAGAFVLGYVGRIVRAKGIFDVLDALAGGDPGTMFLVMGSGPDRAAFEARAAELGLSGRVRIVDPQAPQGVASFLRALDIFLLLSHSLPTWKEQFGRVIIEAQACGVAVIGSQSGSIPEVVGAGGWIVPEGEPAALAALIARLHGAPAEIEGAARAGLDNVATRFTYGRIAAQLLDIYRTAAALPRCAAAAAVMAVALYDAAFDGREEAGLLARLRRRKTLFAAVFAGIFAIVALVYEMTPTSYLASGAVMVTAYPAELDGGMSNAAEQKLGDPADMDTQIVVARSPRLLRAMLANPAIVRAVREDCEAVRRSAPVDVVRTLLRFPPLACDAALAGDRAQTWLSDRFTIANAGRSRVIQIAYSSHVPAVAAALVNGLIDAYLAQGAADKQVPRVQAESWVRLELARLGDELKQSELAIESFRREHGLVRGQVASISAERLTEVSQLLATAEAAEAAARGRLDQLRNGASDARQALESRTIADLKQQLAVVSGQVANMSETFGPHYPGLAALTQQRNDLRQRLAEETARIGPSAERDYESAAAQVRSLRAQLDGLKQQVGQGDLAETQIASMVRDNDVKRQLYLNLSNKANDIEAQRRLLTADVQLVNYAEVPEKAASPKPLLFVLAGAMLACVAAAAAALARDRSDATVRAHGWLEAWSGTPVLGHIPYLGRLTGDFAGGAGGRLAQPGALQEAVRALYTRCILLGGGERLQTILLSSAESGEGKSFLALALAQFAAGAGQRVLVVEGDMRRPGFRAAFHLPACGGLAGVLGAGLEYEAAVQQTAFGFDILPAGTATVASTELLGNGRVAALLAWAKTRYDLVLIDSPPALLLMDAYVLARCADAILFCARWGHTPAEAVVESVRTLREAGGNVIGLAIGMVKPKEYGLYEPRRLPRQAYLAPPA